MRFRICLLLSIFFPIGLWGQSLADLAAVKTNIFNTMTNKSASRTDPHVARAISQISNEAYGYFNSQLGAGSWADIDYNTDTGVSTHYKRVHKMAQVFGTPGITGYGWATWRDKVQSGLAFVTNNPAQTAKYGNWWNWYIGIPKNFLGPTLLFMKCGKADYFTAPAVYAASTNNYHQMIRPINPAYATGGNGLDIVQTEIFEAIWRQDPLALQAACSRCSNLLWLQTDLANEGVMADYSFHQHGPSLYNGGYGGGFVEEMALFMGYTKGTPFALSPSSSNNFRNFMDAGISFMIHHNYFDVATIGRSVTRGSEMALDGLHGLLFMSQVPGPSQNLFTGRAKKILSTWVGSGFDLRFAHGVSFVSNSTLPEVSPTGNRRYPYSDYTLRRASNYFISVKMYSARTRPYEFMGGGEGKKSWHLSDGMTYLTLTGNEYMSGNVWPAMDWSRLPGTTVEQRPLPTPTSTYGSFTTNQFVGGATGASEGVSAMDYAANDSSVGYTRLRFKKSWFFYDDTLICLGSDIRCQGSEYQVETVINQRPMAQQASPLSNSAYTVLLPFDGTLTGVTWAQCEKVGYFFPGGSDIRARLQNQTGAWADIGTGNSTPYTKPVMTLVLDHGVNPGGAKYAYAVLPQKSAAQTRAYSTSNPFVILEQSSSKHGVRDTHSFPVTNTGVVFWEAGSLGPLTTDFPCIVNCRENGTNVALAFSEPTFQSKTVKVSYYKKLAFNGTPPSYVTLTNAGGKCDVYWAAQKAQNMWAAFFRLP